MHLYKFFVLFVIPLTLCSCGHQFTRVTPGESVEIALARKAVPVHPLPLPEDRANVPAVEPDLPRSAESVGDFFIEGNMLLQEKKYEEAAARYQKAIDLDPSFAEAYYNLALCYQETGQADKALEMFRKYKEKAANP